jgi:hypothetical protein
VITRIWHGRSKTEDPETYRQFVIETGVSDYKSIKQFAGEDFSKVKYYEEDKQYLLEFEPEVQHFDYHDFRNWSYLQPEYRHYFKVVL